MFTDSIKDYLHRAAKVPRLTAADEKELAGRIAKGDREAAKRMAAANLKLVVSIAIRYRGKGLPLADLIGEGNIGLIIAVERYDAAQGKFSTYATYWIRQCIGRAIFNTAGTVRLPVHVAERRNKLYKRRKEISGKHTAASDAAFLAEEHGLSEEEVDRLLGMEQFGLSLDHEYGDDETTTMHNFLEDDNPTPHEAAEETQRAAHIRGWLSGLNDKQRIVIESRFGFDGNGEKTLEETAKGLNLTRERIRQIEVDALKKLRKTARFMNGWKP